jgi:hypothetical protein
VIAAIEKLMKHETAGDPVTGLKWTRRTTAKIAGELGKLGIKVGRSTVGRLLREMDYSLRANRKKLAGKKDPDRDQQFRYIGRLRETFEQQRCPVISVDSKKKEMVGQFKNPGVVWAQEAMPVNDHDFRSMARGIAIPYGVYDTAANRGSVFIGTSYDTPAFAVDCIERWWRTEGKKRYPRAPGLLILADNGGGNGSTSRVWKRDLQEKLCDRHGLSVTVCHYPPGTSKWNPIEHRLFSEITKNWAGRPLDTYETILKYTRTTTTKTGLKVSARLIRKPYKKGQTVTDKRMKQLHLDKHTVLPKWNYTLYPANRKTIT